MRAANRATNLPSPRRTSRPRRGTDGRGLAGAELEQAVLALLTTNPDIVAVRFGAGPPLRRHTGHERRQPYIVHPADLPARWAAAVQAVRTRVGRDGKVTMAAVAMELGHVSVRTAYRYRGLYGLQLGDEALPTAHRAKG